MQNNSVQYEPIKLHPENPHYFLFRDKPTILFTSGEHYAVVMNKHFDYIKYLDTLQSLGFNHTRVYTGVKRERPGEHNIDGNSLAVLAEDFIGPWKRTDIPGALDGGNLYDLDQFDDEYFDRFKAVLEAASERGIELEIILFGPLHLGGDNVGPWGVCPLNPVNNINLKGEYEFDKVLSLQYEDMVAYMDKYVVKMVTELNDFDNFHFEIANEPYTYPGRWREGQSIYSSEALRLPWQQHVANLVFDTEAKLKYHHLISCNYSAGYGEIDKPLEHVGLYCYHYVHPETVKRNAALNVAIGMNETGINTSGKYARQAWQTVLGGLALYNMLDYSFNMGHEDGTYLVQKSSPAYAGITGPEIRDQLKVVNDFINTFDFIKMTPSIESIKFTLSLNPVISVMAEKNKQYAIYLVDNQHSGYPYALAMGVYAENGKYIVKISDAKDGAEKYCDVLEAKDGFVEIHWATPETYNENHEIELAISIKRVEE